MFKLISLIPITKQDWHILTRDSLSLFLERICYQPVQEAITFRVLSPKEIKVVNDLIDDKKTFLDQRLWLDKVVISLNSILYIRKYHESNDCVAEFIPEYPCEINTGNGMGLLDTRDHQTWSTLVSKESLTGVDPIYLKSWFMSFIRSLAIYGNSFSRVLSQHFDLTSIANSIKPNDENWSLIEIENIGQIKNYNQKPTLFAHQSNGYVFFKSVKNQPIECALNYDLEFNDWCWNESVFYTELPEIMQEGILDYIELDKPRFLQPLLEQKLVDAFVKKLRNLDQSIFSRYIHSKLDSEKLTNKVKDYILLVLATYFEGHCISWARLVPKSQENLDLTIFGNKKKYFISQIDSLYDSLENYLASFQDITSQRHRYIIEDIVEFSESIKTEFDLPVNVDNAFVKVDSQISNKVLIQCSLEILIKDLVILSSLFIDESKKAQSLFLRCLKKITSGYLKFNKNLTDHRVTKKDKLNWIIKNIVRKDFIPSDLLNALVLELWLSSQLNPNFKSSLLIMSSLKQIQSNLSICQKLPDIMDWININIQKNQQGSLRLQFHNWSLFSQESKRNRSLSQKLLEWNKSKEVKIKKTNFDSWQEYSQQIKKDHQNQLIADAYFKTLEHISLEKSFGLFKVFCLVSTIENQMRAVNVIVIETLSPTRKRTYKFYDNNLIQSWRIRAKDYKKLSIERLEVLKQELDILCAYFVKFNDYKSVISYSYKRLIKTKKEYINDLNQKLSHLIENKLIKQKQEDAVHSQCLDFVANKFEQCNAWLLDNGWINDPNVFQIGLDLDIEWLKPISIENYCQIVQFIEEANKNI
ncbi:hypothetical protein DID75_01265, partial [Candidatus Marinamargulisbacteria bacterium SCGC AG-410-N11]